jgi:hypothetical protein
VIISSRALLPSMSYSYDATGGPELKRLLANVCSVQREVDATWLSRVAQLLSGPGLAPVEDRVWPPRSLEPDYLMRSRDSLRGPRTMIKIIFLVVSIILEGRSDLRAPARDIIRV